MRGGDQALARPCPNPGCPASVALPVPGTRVGGQENLMEGLKAQPRGAGSEGSASPGEGLVSEPGNPSLAFLSPEPQGAHLRPQSGPALSPTPSPKHLARGQTSQNYGEGGRAPESLLGPWGERALESSLEMPARKSGASLRKNYRTLLSRYEESQLELKENHTGRLRPAVPCFSGSSPASPPQRVMKPHAGPGTRS